MQGFGCRGITNPRPRLAFAIPQALPGPSLAKASAGRPSRGFGLSISGGAYIPSLLQSFQFNLEEDPW